MTLEEGTRAPDFTLKDQDGKDVSLDQLVGSKELILYFYPKDETPGCTAEACTFRDHWEDLAGIGASVVGVSSDSPESHRNFIAHRKLQFPLLSDPDRKVRRLYDCDGLLIPKRVTYIIDKSGVIRNVFNSQINARGHVENAIEFIKKFRESSP
ncbi:MAG: peroxiredoxin [Candidatus Thermoplasmatota archaeon]|nr:peroxiredoxin [Candidatus Thermoplasmatota archaeon]MCL5786165.1 peroxiredoxin [Candidatus Thermoplasmatota archaeon]